METNKIGFLETYNDQSNRIEKSSDRLYRGLALVTGLTIAMLSIIPYFGISLGDSLPMVLLCMAYSLGSSAWNKVIEMKYKHSDK